MNSGSKSNQPSFDAESLLDCLLVLIDAAPDMRLNQVVMFLVTARSEGLLMADLTRRCGESKSTVSRAIRKLSSPGDPGALPPAYGLVEVLSGARDKRYRHIVLTDKGRALYQRMAHIPRGRGTDE